MPSGLSKNGTENPDSQIKINMKSILAGSGIADAPADRLVKAHRRTCAGCSQRSQNRVNAIAGVLGR